MVIQFRGFGWSDAGLVASWTNSLGDFGILDLKATVINGLGSDSNVLDDNTVQLDDGMMLPVVRPRDGLVQNEEVNELMDNNNNKATVLKASFKPMSLPMDFGVSWYRGAWDPSGKQNLQMLGGHLNWLARNWTVKGEYVTADVEQDAGILIVDNSHVMNMMMLDMVNIANTTVGDYKMNAFYVEGSIVPLRWGKPRRSGIS